MGEFAANWSDAERRRATGTRLPGLYSPGSPANVELAPADCPPDAAMGAAPCTTDSPPPVVRPEESPNHRDFADGHRGYRKSAVPVGKSLNFDMLEKRDENAMLLKRWAYALKDGYHKKRELVADNENDRSVETAASDNQSFLLPVHNDPENWNVMEKAEGENTMLLR